MAMGSAHCSIQQVNWGIMKPAPTSI